MRLAGRSVGEGQRIDRLPLVAFRNELIGILISCSRRRLTAMQPAQGHVCRSRERQFVPWALHLGKDRHLRARWQFFEPP